MEDSGRVEGPTDERQRHGAGMLGQGEQREEDGQAEDSEPEQAVDLLLEVLALQVPTLVVLVQQGARRLHLGSGGLVDELALRVREQVLHRPCRSRLGAARRLVEEFSGAGP